MLPRDSKWSSVAMLALPFGGHLSEDHPVRRGALASYLGGVLVLLTVWIVGWWPRAWRALVAVLGGRYSITLPLWLWLLILSAACAFVWRLFRRAPAAPKTAPAPKWPQLDDLELSIMLLFQERDGRPLSYAQVLAANSISSLRLSKAVERLEAFGMVEMPLDSIRLTRIGRDFVLELGEQGTAGELS